MLSSTDKSSKISDKEALLITLQRPIVFVHPVSFDKGNDVTLPVMICNKNTITDCS